MKNESSVIATLAEPRRQQLVRLLWHAERSAGDLASEMPVSFSAVSQHLGVLLDAGVVERRRAGRTQIYRLNKPALGPLAPALEQMWFGALSSLKDMAEAEERRKKPGANRKSAPTSRNTGTPNATTPMRFPKKKGNAP